MAATSRLPRLTVDNHHPRMDVGPRRAQTVTTPVVGTVPMISGEQQPPSLSFSHSKSRGHIADGDAATENGRRTTTTHDVYEQRTGLRGHMTVMTHVDAVHIISAE
ncbi:hypothetical protein K443DRAFT_4658 [Laccaria amethystina LaAM-08-1]|uniref:Uncharacterized protein n=1 Tax=Laccaria amethystina LaAM-08-1 TaxID=1095629 RepID=A0A0C9WXS1_9AGAR|nr:hypothetical protein K443DRAFT_4658 [Laccaria amethystina LaAM-08-1]